MWRYKSDSFHNVYHETEKCSVSIILSETGKGQRRIQDFVRGGAKLSDVRNMVAISAKCLARLSFNTCYSSSNLHTFKQAKNQSGTAQNTLETLGSTRSHTH